jgi:hypothetical protein
MQSTTLFVFMVLALLQAAVAMRKLCNFNDSKHFERGHNVEPETAKRID